MSMLEPEARKAADMFGLSADEMQTLMDVPYRGSLPAAVPTDPLIYRFYEAGLGLRHHVEGPRKSSATASDGIMSAI
jgi:cyanate lyase